MRSTGHDREGEDAQRGSNGTAGEDPQPCRVAAGGIRECNCCHIQRHGESDPRSRHFPWARAMGPLLSCPLRPLARKALSTAWSSLVVRADLALACSTSRDDAQLKASLLSGKCRPVGVTPVVSLCEAR